MDHDEFTVDDANSKLVKETCAPEQESVLARVREAAGPLVGSSAESGPNGNVIEVALHLTSQSVEGSVVIPAIRNALALCISDGDHEHVATCIYGESVTVAAVLTFDLKLELGKRAGQGVPE